MTPNDLSEELKGFIGKHIDSVGKLEVLLLLAAGPEKTWTCAAISRELRSNDSSALKNLNELARSGLVKANKDSPPLFHFEAESEELKNSVSELVKIYPIFHSRIIHLIYSRPISKIQDFANAFRIRKDDNEDDR